MSALQKRQSPHEAGFGNNNRLGGRRDSTSHKGNGLAVYAAKPPTDPRRCQMATTGQGRSPVDELLVRLEGVQAAGAGWRARCPSCGGKGRKLSLASGDDGRVLMTCFGCHDTPAILASLGLSVADLFANRSTHDLTPLERQERRRRARESNWSAALGVLGTEATVVEVAAAMIERGQPLEPDDIERVHVAAQRIHDARAVLR